MKYKLNQHIFWLGKKCIIIGTKTEPYKPEFDIYNRVEIKPQKDYLLFILNKIENNVCHYSGIVDVSENEIEDIIW